MFAYVVTPDVDGEYFQAVAQVLPVILVAAMVEFGVQIVAIRADQAELRRILRELDAIEVGFTDSTSQVELDRHVEVRLRAKELKDQLPQSLRLLRGTFRLVFVSVAFGVVVSLFALAAKRYSSFEVLLTSGAVLYSGLALVNLFELRFPSEVKRSVGPKSRATGGADNVAKQAENPKPDTSPTVRETEAAEDASEAEDATLPPHESSRTRIQDNDGPT